MNLYLYLYLYKVQLIRVSLLQGIYLGLVTRTFSSRVETHWSKNPLLKHKYHKYHNLRQMCWGVANVTTVTFNSILVIVFQFLLNVSVSPCFHCTLLVPVYKVYTFFHNTAVSSCCRLHTSCIHHEGATFCSSLNMWF